MLIAVEVAVVPTLHRLGDAPGMGVEWGNLGRWLTDSPPDDAVLAVLRLVALACAYWVLATTALYLVARLTRVPALVAGIRWATLPGIRKLVDATVAVSIVGSAVMNGEAARAVPPPTTRPPVVVELSTTTTVPGNAALHAYVPVPASDPAAAGVGGSNNHAPRAFQPTPAGDVPPPSTTTTPTSAPAVSPPAVSDLDDPQRHDDTVYIHVVVKGENLWTIAASELGQQTGRQPLLIPEAEIRAYWLKVIDGNRHRLSSGDPNLIFPDERMACPPSQDL